MNQIESGMMTYLSVSGFFSLTALVALLLLKKQIHETKKLHAKLDALLESPKPKSAKAKTMLKKLKEKCQL